MTENAIAKEIVDAAFHIHTALGPGLLESVYQAVLAYELSQRGLRTVSQQPIPVVYGTIRIDTGFRADLIVEDQVIVEIKSVEVAAHQLQRGPDQARHHPNRQRAGRRVSRKVARTPRKPMKVRGCPRFAQPDKHRRRRAPPAI